MGDSATTGAAKQAGVLIRHTIGVTVRGSDEGKSDHRDGTSPA